MDYSEELKKRRKDAIRRSLVISKTEDLNCTQDYVAYCPSTSVHLAIEALEGLIGKSKR